MAGFSYLHDNSFRSLVTRVGAGVSRVDGEGGGEASAVLKEFIEKFSVGVKTFYTTRIDSIPNLYFSTSPVSKTLPTS